MNKALAQNGNKKPARILFLHVPLQERILFCKHLAITVKSGMSLIDGIKLIRGQAKSASMKMILDEIIENLTRGVFLSTSLEKYKNIFGNLFVSVMHIAEASGTLPENLNYLAVELKKKSDLRKRVRGAMVYPIIILCMTLLIVTMMILFVFPKLLPLFESLDVELPLTTRILIGFSSFITHYGIWVLAGVILAGIGWKFLLKLPSVRIVVHRIVIFIPVFGRAVIAYNMTNLTRTLAILLRSGVHIVNAVKITAEGLVNLAYQKELEEASDEVQRGVYFSKHLTMRPRYFPPILANMLEVGENTGNLTDNLLYLADYYESELDDFVKNLSGILEPILLLFMGVIVGFIALAFITPLYQITKGF